MESLSNLRESEFDGRKQAFYQLKERLTLSEPEDYILREEDTDFQNIEESVPDQNILNEIDSDLTTDEHF